MHFRSRDPRPQFLRSRGLYFADGVVARAVRDDVNSQPYVELFSENATGDWSLFVTIEDPYPELGLDFGSTLAYDNGRLLVGTTHTQRPAADVPNGRAYLFTLVPEPSCLMLLAIGSLAGLARRRR